MCKIIFYVLIIVGLCFGQSIWLKENPKINLPMPINGAIKSEGINEITMRRFSLYSSQPFSLISPLNPNTLIMQVEGETLQPKTSFWKQAGIYGLEFLGAEVGVGVSFFITACVVLSSFEHDPESVMLTKVYGAYIISNMVITSTCVWSAGNLMKQKRHWWRAAIGAGVGSIIGLIPEFLDPGHGELLSFKGALFLGLPSLGAVIGFNL